MSYSIRVFDSDGPDERVRPCYLPGDTDLSQSLGCQPGVFDTCMEQLGQVLHRGRLLGLVGKVDHLVCIGPMVVEFGTLAALDTPFGIPVAQSPNAVATGILREGRLPRTCGRII